MTHIRLLMLCVMFEVLPMVAFAQPVATESGWLESMRLGGYVIVLRHGLTGSDASKDAMANPSRKVDPKADSRPDAMSATAKPAGERQLSEQGRAQAKLVGEMMRRFKVPVGLVMTSPLQRAVDTGTLLGFGETVSSPDLAEAGSALPPEENKRRAEALRKLVSMHPPVDNNLVIVTHKPNIVDAFGKDWDDVRECDASVFKPDGNGSYKLIVRIPADEWGKLVQASN
jgi:phosphohistidine phosphatase SixA